ncbi:MAG TPA: hypothetical protein VL793_16235 [Patescibacteria group bacterium]|nr:hypothetical protein [Patescibacteria group bacterium]
MKFIGGRVLAGAVVILGTLLMTLVCYAFALATAPNGIDTPAAVIPEFLILMVTVGIFAVIVSTASFLVSVLEPESSVRIQQASHSLERDPNQLFRSC